MSLFEIVRGWRLENHSKKRIGLLIVRFPIYNERYAELVQVGGNAGSIETRGLGNVFVRYKFRDLAPNDEREVRLKLVLRRKRPNVPDDFGALSEVPANVRNDFIRMASRAPRRVRKIAESVAHKCVNVREVVDEVLAFIERNFEKVDEETTLSDLLVSNRGNHDAIATFFVLVCSLAGVPARKVYGIVADENRRHTWAEIYVKGSWIEVDPWTGHIGDVPEHYLPIKVENPATPVPDVKIVTIKSAQRGVITGIEISSTEFTARRIGA